MGAVPADRLARRAAGLNNPPPLAEEPQVSCPVVALWESMRQWEPRPGWVRVPSVVPSFPLTRGIGTGRGVFSSRTTPRTNHWLWHGLDRVIVVLPPWRRRSPPY